MVDNVKIFIGGPNDGLKAQERIHRLIEEQIKHTFRERCVVDSFLWNTQERKRLTDGETPRQRRIDQHQVNTGSCDLLIMYFKVEPRGVPIGDGFARMSFQEIEAALDRPNPPRTLFLFEDVDRDMRMGDLSDDQVEAQLARRRVSDDVRQRIDLVLAPHRKNLGRPLSVERLKPRQVETLESAVRDLLEQVVDEILAARKPPIVPEPPPAPLPQPYRGLRELTIDDGDIFFGHTKSCEAILGSLRADPELGLVYIHGPSGTGKSSLLKAGLLHQLIRKQAIADRPRWAHAEFKPSDGLADPFRGLVEACLTHTGSRLSEDRDQLIEDLRRASVAGVAPAREVLKSLLGQLPAGADGLVIAVNQLEELWSVAPAWCEPFLNLIAAAADTPGLLVLATLRPDRLEAFTGAPQLLPILQRQKALAFPLGPADRSMLVEVIRQPARKAEVTLEEGLAGTIAERFGTCGDAALPMVAVLMRKLWRPDETGPPRTLITHADLEAAGSPAEIIQTLVARVNVHHDKTVLQALFNELTDVRDGKVVAVPVPSEVLVAGDKARARLVEQLASQAHVLQIGDGPGSPVRLTHEALFEMWPALKEWIEFDLDDYATRDELLREARTWDERGRTPREIRMSNERLDDLQELQSGRPDLFDRLTHAERDLLSAYLQACEVVREQQRLVLAVNGGEMTNAAAALRNLRRLRPKAKSVLDLAYRGHEYGNDPGQLKCQFWAAVTGDDESGLNPNTSIFEGPEGKKRIEFEASRRRTPTTWAACAGQLELLRKLIDLGADRHQLDHAQGNLIHAAATGGDRATVAYLIELGVDPVALDDEGVPPITWAIQGNHREVVDLLMPYGDVNFSARDGWNAFTEAARGNDVALLEQLVESGDYAVDYATPSGVTALHSAVISDRAVTDEAVAWLIKHGAPLYLADSQQMTALHYAALRGNVAAIDMLLDAVEDGDSAKFLAMRDRGGATALHMACSNRRANAVRRLIARGADVNLYNSDGHSPLTLAVDRADLRSVRLLLDAPGLSYRLDDAVKDIHFAVHDGDPRMLAMLLRAGPPEAVNGFVRGFTPTMVAAHFGKSAIANVLLDFGADLSLKQPEIGRDALEIALQAGHRDVLEILKTWALRRGDLSDRLESLALRERELAMQDLSETLAQHRPSSASSAPVIALDTPEDVRARLMRGVERADAASILEGVAASGSIEMLEAALELARPLLDATDLDRAAEAAGARGLASMVSRLVESGATEPWWYRRRRLSEHLNFLKFQPAGPSISEAFLAEPAIVLPATGDRLRLRFSAMPFLPDHQLVVAECLDSKGRNEVFYLRDPAGSFVRLNWESFEINRAMDRSGVLNAKNVAAYVRWVLCMVRRPDVGQISLVEHDRDLPWLSRRSQDRRALAAFSIRPLSVRQQSADEIVADATLLYDDAIYRGSIHVALRHSARFSGEAASLAEVWRGQIAVRGFQKAVGDLPIHLDGVRGLFG